MQPKNKQYSKVLKKMTQHLYHLEFQKKRQKKGSKSIQRSVWFFTSQKSRQRAISRGQTTGRQKRREGPATDPQTRSAVCDKGPEARQQKKTSLFNKDTEAIR